MKIRVFIFLLLMTAALIPLNVQPLRRPIAAQYAGIGAYSLTHADIFSFTTNQASLAQLKNVQAAVYRERRFLLNELNHYSAAIGLTTKSGNFGVEGSYYGFSHYNETQLGLAYGRKLGDKVDLGVQFNYNGVKVTSYGTARAISFETGALFHLTQKLHAGLHIANPVGGRFGKDQQEKLTSVYAFGIGYEASDKFFASTEIIKEEDQPVNANAGIQYKFLPQVWTRLGITTATSTVWMGAGFSRKLLRFDVTAGYHPQLGITPGLLLLFDFKPA